jgi:hypothetical protein
LSSLVESTDGISNIAKWAANYLVKKKEQEVAAKTKMETAPPVVEVTKKKTLSDYFQNVPCIYSHRVFRNAGLLYRALRHEEDMEEAFYARHAPNFKMANANQTIQPVIKIPRLDFDDEDERRLTFELAFNTLKCK